MDYDQKEIAPVKEKPVYPKELTIMVIRSVGRPFSFKISHRIILWASLIVIAYILVSLYTLNRFVFLHRQYNIQSERLEKLEKEHDNSLKALNQTNEYVKGLEEYIKSSGGLKRAENQSLQKEELPAKAIDKTGTDFYKKDRDEQKTPSIVDIKDVVIKKEGSAIVLDFRLANATQEQYAIEGYLHIIAMDKKGNYPQEWSYPRDTLKDGFPVDFRLGQSFFIQRFKSYHRQFGMSSNSELPKAIRLLVYNRSGELILKKEFEVDNGS
ncbi:MAG TPA: hypothetical protein VJ373_04300 [Desulfatiglandales bacterium]|nr:hypothetical protein [Desulfatiglandales bacterium]